MRWNPPSALVAVIIKLRWFSPFASNSEQVMWRQTDPRTSGGVGSHSLRPGHQSRDPTVGLDDHDPSSDIGFPTVLVGSAQGMYGDAWERPCACRPTS